MSEKLLILVRHGDAEEVSYKYPNSDLSRELTSLGMTKINRVSNFLQSKNIYLNKLFTSNATRTIQTGNIIARKLGYNIDSIENNPFLYKVTPNEVLTMLSDLEDDVSSVLIVGHNPWITDLGEYIVGKPTGHISPGGIVSIKLDNMNWSNIHRREAELLFVKNFLQGSLTLA